VQICRFALTLQSKDGEIFGQPVPILPINFEEILSLAHGNFEEQIKVLELFIILINR
jgi:hypothetical protein